MTILLRRMTIRLRSNLIIYWLFVGKTYQLTVFGGWGTILSYPIMRWNEPGVFWNAPGAYYDLPDSSTLNPIIPMAKDQTKRLEPKTIQEDKDVVAAITTLAPAYAPANAAYSLANLNTAQSGMATAQATEVQKQGEADAARDTANTAEWAFHNKVLEAKKQVAAQYGSDSDQLQAIGLKKKSEYSKPTKKKPATP